MPSVSSFVSREQIAEAQGWDLAVLASYAAIEIDNLVLGRADDLTTVKRLLIRLSEPSVVLASPERGGNSASVESFRDPLVDVVKTWAVRAVMDAPPAGRERLSVQAIASRGDELVAGLQDVVRDIGSNPDRYKGANQTKEDTERLKELRAFCLALSQKASAHKRSLQSSQPERFLRS